MRMESDEVAGACAPSSKTAREYMFDDPPSVGEFLFKLAVTNEHDHIEFVSNACQICFLLDPVDSMATPRRVSVDEGPNHTLVKQDHHLQRQENRCEVCQTYMCSENIKGT